MAKRKLPINQDPEIILRRMALTVRGDDPKDAYRTSCHATTCRSLIAGLRSGKLLDSDEIVLLGNNDCVWHSIMIRGDKIISDSDISANASPYFNKSAEGGIYGFSGSTLTMSVVKRITIADFKKEYLIKPEMPKPPGNNPEPV